jgi:hypothetical protein
MTNNSIKEHTVDTASPIQHGKWLRFRSTFGPSAAVITAAAKGDNGISQSTIFWVVSDMF